MCFLRGSDFQSREYFKLSLSHLDGRSIDDLGKMVQYQVDCMRAVASGLMPPAPPLGLDMSPPKEGMPSATASPPMIDAEPFDSSAFTSEVVKKEYDVLRRDHRQLIKMGEAYGDFDPLGKLAFLDQVEQIEERWDIFFGRLGLLGQLSPDYRQQSSDFLDTPLLKNVLLLFFTYFLFLIWFLTISLKIARQVHVP